MILNNIINKMYLIEHVLNAIRSCRVQHCLQMRICYQNWPYAGSHESLNKLQITEIIQIMFSDNSGIQFEISKKKQMTRNIPNVWKCWNMFLNNRGLKIKWANNFKC